MAPDTPDPIDELTVHEDDAVIGKAFKWSLLVIAVIVAAVIAVLQVTGGDDEPPPTEQADLEGPGAVVKAERAPQVTFTDVTQAAGIEFVQRSGATGGKYLPETMGAGCAFIDYDGDGDQDLLFATGTPELELADSTFLPPAFLYRNDGSGRFTDATEESGIALLPARTDRRRSWVMGIAVGDYDADGDPDVFLTGIGQDRLLRNDAGRFTDVTTEAGLAPHGAWTTSAGFHDLDADGDLDLFVCSYVKWSEEIDDAQNYTLQGVGRAYGPPTAFQGEFCLLYRNDGNGTFTDVSSEAGIRVTNKATGDPVGKALGVVFHDFEGDGDTDVFVANDTVRNFLFRNEGDLRFEEVGELAGVAYDSRGGATGAMGVDAADVRGSGALAVAVGNFASEMSSLYFSRPGKLLFNDAAISEGIGAPSRQALSFGLFFFDYDLDGRLDLFQTNGHLEEAINTVQPSQHYEQPSQLFWNRGREMRSTYALVEADSVGDLSRPVVGRGCAYGDMDGDGDLDVVITQVGRPPLLLRNDQTLGHHWLRVRLVPKRGSPIGARVTVTAGDREQTLVVAPTRSYLSQVELPLTFGLGTAQRVERLEVTWPDGTRETRTDVGVDETLVLTQP